MFIETQCEVQAAVVSPICRLAHAQRQTATLQTVGQY